MSFKVAASRDGPGGYGLQSGPWGTPIGARGKQKWEKSATMLVNISGILGFW